MKTHWGSFNQRPLGHEPSALTKRNKRIITFFEGVFFAVRVDSELPLAFLIVSTLPFLLKRQKCETNYYFFRHYLKLAVVPSVAWDFQYFKNITLK